MPKDKLPRPIHFPLPIEISTDGNGIEQAAIKRYKELVNKKCHGDIYLIFTNHWASRGYWIIFKFPEVTFLDRLLEEHHNKNPKPWIPPPPNTPDDEEDEE